MTRITLTLIQILTITLAQITCRNYDDWCNKELINCGQFEHVMCGGCPIDDTMEQPIIPLTNWEKRWLLHWHNKFRSDFATDPTKGNGLLEGYKPTDMYQLRWDDNLERMAQCSVLKHHHCAFDDCLISFDYDHIGQTCLGIIDTNRDCKKQVIIM